MIDTSGKLRSSTYRLLVSKLVCFSGKKLAPPRSWCYRMLFVVSSVSFLLPPPRIKGAALHGSRPPYQPLQVTGERFFT